GSVIHGLEDEQDLKRMGALRKWLPWTFGTFMVGWLAIAGVPPFSGFWSKGDVLTNVFAKSPALYAVGVLTALGTAYYMSRLFYLTYTGKARWQDPAPDGRPVHPTPPPGASSTCGGSTTTASTAGCSRCSATRSSSTTRTASNSGSWPSSTGW